MLERILNGIRWISREEGREAVQLLFRELRYLLRHMRFRKISGKASIGQADPYKAGQMLAYLGMLYPIYHNSLQLDTYFDRDELQGEVHIRGHLRLIHVLMSGIRLLMNKEIRKLVLEGGMDGADESDAAIE